MRGVAEADDCVCCSLGKNRARSGRSGGMLTQIMPMEHSMTDQFRHSTSSSVHGQIIKQKSNKGDERNARSLLKLSTYR